MDTKINSAQVAIRNSVKLIEEEAAATGAKKNVAKSKGRMRKVLAGAQQVSTILDVVAKVHPVTENSVNAFKGVIKLEVDRKENNEQIVSVCYSMAMMMYALHHLTGSHSPDESEGDEVLMERLDDLTSSIKAFGEFINFYYNKCSKLVRLVRSAEFKVQLTAHANTFDEHRSNITMLLSAQSAGGQMVLQQEVERLSQSIEVLVERFGAPVDEVTRQAQAFIDERGGAEEVIEDMEAIQHVSKMLKDPLTSSKLSALKEDLTVLLDENRNQFELKLEGAQLEIQESIGRSTQTILTRLNEGPHDLIEDVDLKEIWKQSAWRLSVKSRIFADALYDHYSQKFKQIATESEDGEAPSDHWTLKVFSKVINHPSIGQAIDEDDSGFVSVHEVNHLVQKRPEGWTTPVWLSFWAVGWDFLNIQYTYHLISAIAEIQEAVQPIRDKFEGEENLLYAIDNYLVTIRLVGYLLRWLPGGNVTGLEDLDGQTASEVVRISEDYSNAQVKRMEDQLQKIKFVLDDAAYMPIITQQARMRIEQVIMPLLFIILHHHQQTILNESANLDELDPQEFATTWHSMDLSLSVLVIQFHYRMKSLMRSWRSQKEDVDVHVACYASGLFGGWYQEYNRRGSEVRKYLETDEGSQEDKPGDDTAKINALTDRVDQLDARLERIEGMLNKLLSQEPAGASVQGGGNYEEGVPEVNEGQYDEGGYNDQDY